MRSLATAVVTSLVISLVLLGRAPSTPATDRPADQPSNPAGAVAGATIDALEPRFLTTRPAVGPTWVVDLAGTGTAERVLARTLQGVVNRTEARAYLLDPGDGGDEGWIQEYEDRGLVEVVGTTDLDGLLDRFAGEAAGYVLASEAEPWTIDVAATIATAEGGVVATPELVPLLSGRGLTEIDDVRGRWPDAATAYEALVAERYQEMGSPSMAVLRPGDSLWDFTAQQGILTLFTRPGDPSWARVSALLARVPDDHAVYGYLSDTGEEEAVAVATLSANGTFLVPTDTTRNLSFHVAVGADHPRERVPERDLHEVAACTSDTLNVVVGLTDGDNVNVPLNHFRRTGNWPDPARGTLPLTWSMGPQLAVLAPAAWDTYAREVAPTDELAAVIGYGYAAPLVHPDPVGFYGDSFALMAELGLTSFWSLGGGLEVASASGWTTLDAAADAAGAPSSVLVGYGNGQGTPAAFHSPGGRLALTSGTGYGDTPADIADHLRELAARPAAERPAVVFVSATNWSNPAGDLVRTLAPLRDEGVRFLTAGEAAACLPPAPVDPPPEVGPGTCLPTGPITPTGLPLVADIVTGELSTTPTPLGVDVAVDAPAAADPSDVVEMTATITIDRPALARRVRDERVVPLVSGSFGAELAATAWVDMALRDLAVGVDVVGATPHAEPIATSTGPGVDAAWAPTGDGSRVTAVLEPFTESTTAPGEPFTVTLRWGAVPVGPGPSVLEVRAAAPSFHLGLTVGVTLGSTPLAGGAEAAWRCGVDDAVLSTTAVAAPTTTTSPTTTTAPTTTGSSTTTAPARVAPTTTAPASPAAAPPATASPRFTG